MWTFLLCVIAAIVPCIAYIVSASKDKSFEHYIKEVSQSDKEIAA